MLVGANFNARPVKYVVDNKKEFYKHLISLGLEGTVAKRLDGVYVPDTTRNFKGWVKCKRSLSDSLSAFNSQSSLSAFDTLDDVSGDITFHLVILLMLFITGYELGNKGSAFENMIGSICVLCMLKKKMVHRKLERLVSSVVSILICVRIWDCCKW